MNFFPALGYTTGIAIFLMESKRLGFNSRHASILALGGAAAGMVVARVAELVFEGWPATIPASVIVDPTVGGKSLLAGVIGGWMAVELLKRRLGVSGSVGNLVALALPAGEAVGRVGCYLEGCCYGKACSLPWAVYQHGAFRHPTQLYSLLAAVATFMLLLNLRARLTLPSQLFSAYLICFGLSRFVIEVFRDSPATFAGLTLSQLVALALAGVGVWRLGRQRTNPAPINPHPTVSAIEKPIPVPEEA